MWENWRSVQDRKYVSRIDTPRINLNGFKEKLNLLEIPSTDYMMDWRIYSLFFFTNAARATLRVKHEWLPHKLDITTIDECYNLWDVIQKEDFPATIENLNSCIASNELDIQAKIGLLLRCKFHLHHSNAEKRHHAYAPIYISQYMKFLKNSKVWYRLSNKNKVWGILSSIHYFPKTIAMVEYKGFPDELSWFKCSFSVINNLLLSR
jgi:hypothetical protein